MGVGDDSTTPEEPVPGTAAISVAPGAVDSSSARSPSRQQSGTHDRGRRGGRFQRHGHAHRSQAWPRQAARFVIALVLALACEVGVFNTPHWKSLQAPAPFVPSIEVGPGLREVAATPGGTLDPRTGVRSYTAGVGDVGADVSAASAGPADSQDYHGRTFEMTGDEDSAYILIDARHTHIDFLTLDISRVDRDADRQADVINWRINADDEYYSEGMWLHTVPFSPVTPSSQRMGTLLSGESTWVRANLATTSQGKNEPGLASPGMRLRINRIIVNEPVPFTFDMARFALVTGLFLLVALLLPSSWIWRRRWNERAVATWGILAVVMVVQAALVVLLVRLQSPWAALRLLQGPEVSTIYQDQLRSLLEGHPWLDETPPPQLVAMPDPYDNTARDALADHTGIVPDYAYRNGRYWSYFGIVPVVLLMLPVRLATGITPPTWACIVACLLACIPASLWLLRRLLRRYAPHASFGTLICLLVAFPALAYTTALLSDIRTYALPNALGLLLCLCALAAWLTAIRDDGTLRAPWIAVGSLLMGLTLGTRPTMAACALLAIPCFWQQLIGRMTRVRDWIAMLLPAAVAAAPVLWWNMIRFGSWLDFGADYNLTNVNMTTGHPGLWESLPIVVFEALLRPINAQWRWPFISDDWVDYSYPRIISSFGMSGGYLAYVPIAVLGLVCALSLVGRRASLARLIDANDDGDDGAHANAVDGRVEAVAGKAADDGGAGMYAHASAATGADEASDARRRLAAPLVVAAVVLLLCLCVMTSQIGGFVPRYDTDWAWLMVPIAACGIGLVEERLHGGVDVHLVVLFRFVVGMLAVLSLLLVVWQTVATGAQESSLVAEHLLQLRSMFMPS